MADNVDESTQTVEEVRTKLVNGVLLVLAFLMVPTATLSWLRIYTVGFQPIMVLHTVVAAVLCIAAASRHRMSLRTKSWMVLGLFYLLAIAGLLTFGLVSLGTDVLLLLTVLTTALLGRNWGWYAVAACEAAVLLIAVGVTTGAVTFTIDIEEYALAPST